MFYFADLFCIFTFLFYSKNEYKQNNFTIMQLVFYVYEKASCWTNKQTNITNFHHKFKN